MQIESIIVDDEPLAREELAFLLGANPEVKLVGQAKNGLEAVELVKKSKPQLMFLDIQMPGLDGLQTIERLISKKIELPKIIFVTAHDDYALNAFDLNAVDYVLKPIDKSRLDKAINKAKQQINNSAFMEQQLKNLVQLMQQGQPEQRFKLLIKSGNRMLLIDSGDIIFANVEDGVISVVTNDLVGTSNYRTLEDLQANLDPKVFWRVHRAYIVNINKIKEVIPWFNRSLQLKMSDKHDTEIPVSRMQSKKLREFLKL
ncbi:MAG: LytTR family DNA-binding domain-containing protein [Acidobacteriia bacterium]|nr:LytTR family DNA-binding domain-containing protein [Terriglobia bacterium]